MEKSPIVEIAKKVCPAVITVVVSKDLPKVEGFYFLPMGGQNLVVPKMEGKNKKEKTKIGGGSGFIVSENGYVITSNHVVADAEAEYTVILGPEKKYPAKVMSRNPIQDIAVLKIEANDMPFLELADSESIDLGESVLAIGNPLGEFHDTISAGIVSGLSRFITARDGFNGTSARLKGLIQTDAAINPGNSGGPLVNMDAQAVGVNTAMVMGAQNIGFAIPINYAKKDLEEVQKFGKIKRPFLGIKYIILNKELSQQNKINIDYGALIIRERLGEEAVIQGSAAAKAGLREFDIILEANGEKITDKNPLSEILDKCQIGQEINFKVLRNKKEIKAKIKLDEKK